MNLTEKIYARVTLKSKSYALGAIPEGNLYRTQTHHGCGEHAPSWTRAQSHPLLVLAQEHFEHKTPVPGTIPDLRSTAMKAFPAQFPGVQNQASPCHASPGPRLSEAARPCPPQALSRGRCYISQGDDQAARTLTVSQAGPPITATPQLCLGPSVTYHVPDCDRMSIYP